MSSATASPEPIRVDPGDWEGAVADTTGSQLIVGGPGSGKTEFLVRRAAHLLTTLRISPQRVIVLGFSRRGVAEVRSRVRAAIQETIGDLDVATFHSYAARLLELHATEAGWAQSPQILTGPEQVAMVLRLLSEEDPALWSPAFNQLLTTRTFAGEVTDFILRAAEQMHTPADLTAYERDDWRGLPQFISTYNRALRSRGRVDYGTLIGEAVKLLETKTAPDDTEPGFVLVDEYQDTTTAQVRLLQALHVRGWHVTVAADPYQSVYSFRGATVENVAEFESRFGNESAPARTVLLTTSFRTPAAILNAAVHVTTGDLPGTTGKVEPAPGAGAVEAYLFDQQVEEADWIACETQRIHLTEGVPYGTIGVFVRSKRRLLADLSRALERRRIPHDLPGTRLSDQPAVRFVLDLATAATRCDGIAAANRALRRVLLGSRVRLTIGEYRALEHHAHKSGSWASSIRTLLPGGPVIANLLEDSAWADSHPASAGLWRLWTEFPGLDEMVNDPDAAEERAAWRSLAQVLARWEERNPDGTILHYRDLVAREDFEAQPLLSYRRPDGDRLTLTTLHQAKGLELEVVFIADAVDGIFPDLRTRDSLLGARHLLPHVPTETAAYRAFRLQEESRLAYTAITRARRRVVWTATERGLDEGPGRPSRFLTKIAGMTESGAGRPTGNIDLWPPSERRPVTSGEAEAALRRCLVDVRVPGPRRLAALTALGHGPAWSLRAPESFSGVPERGNDRGIVDSPLVLSPSQAQGYEQCPRRYALERRLKIGADTSVHATFGTLIHEVLETVETAAKAAGLSHNTVEAALDELERRFDPETFGGFPFAASWLERARRGLGKLYEHWPAPQRSPALLEQGLEAEIGGVRWVGRADRIDIGSGGMTIVDYKTSRQTLKVEEASESLQLGFYVMAAQSDATTAALGPVKGAELWYPMSNARSVTVRKFDMGRLHEIEDRLETIASGIINEDWTPHPGSQCDRCGLRSLCPAWAEGGDEFA